jgi:succinyl-diaminopimelate desuccinylase
VTRLANRLRSSPGVVLIITAGEETFVDGARHLASLDGVLGQAGAIIVAEPTCNYPFVGHKGAFWLRARTSGVTAHGSMPERGVNAVYKAARAALRLEQFRFDTAPHPVLGMPTLNVGTFHGGLNVNSVPDSAEIGIDIRTIPDQKHSRVLEQLAAHLGDDVALENLSDAQGVWSDPGDPWIQSVYDVMTPVIGERPVARAVPYFTDAAALTPAYGGAPTVILGPGELTLAHQTDEYCEVARIEQAVDVFTELTRRWCRV